MPISWKYVWDLYAINLLKGTQIAIEALEFALIKMTQLQLRLLRIFAHCQDNALLHGHGQYGVAAVVHMLANDIHAARNEKVK